MAEEIPSEVPVEVSFVEGTMDINGWKTSGFRFYSLLVLLLIALVFTDIVSAYFGRDLTYVNVIKDLAIFLLGAFIGAKK